MLSPVAPLYVSMLKWSKGPGTARDWQRRVHAQGQLIESRGGELKHSYVTLGRFDIVLIFEAPSDEVAMGIILAISESQSLVSETMRAFSPEEADAILRSI
jgi:uncharacterized protein with GYD domain